MGVKTHPAYAEESVRLKESLVEIRQQLAELRAKPPLNMPELIDDSMEATLVAELALENMRLTAIRQLDRAEREPYFGRLDFHENGEPALERLYIGKTGVARTSSGQPCIIDWRAPIASLFYSSATGESNEVSYEAPDGVHTGLLWLKRNLGIKQSILQRIVDSKVKGAPSEEENVLDEFLAYRLQESRDSRLRDIVSTIQGEQNAIIRAPANRPLIIQGVAGSGKTTVALHRLAYLLYTFRESVVASRMIIFAPNRMFLDYISDVLPELGVDGVVQTTFADWALQELGEQVTLTDPGDRLHHLFGLRRDPGEGADSPGRFKGSLLFREVLDQALDRYEAQFVPDDDFQLWPGAVLRRHVVFEWFHENYRLAPLMSRKERCLARVTKWAEDQFQRFIGTMQESERRKTLRAALQRYARRWPAHNALHLYREIMGARSARTPLIDPVGYIDIPERVVKESLACFKRGQVAPEDLAPLVYIKARLRGYKEDRQLDHVVIDEAQDFSPFQLLLLKTLTRQNSFTILGDLSQGIHAYQGIHHWEEFMELFAPEPCSYFTLELSYRSTHEIMTFANQIISRANLPAPLARPVFRAGAPVSIQAPTEEELPSAIAQEIQRLQTRNHASIAVIGRTEARCHDLHARLNELNLQPELVTAHQTAYRGGISVMPAYLTKGLEFDAVIIADANADAYTENPRDIKLLYVACTRALHELTLFYTEAPSPLLPKAPHAALHNGAATASSLFSTTGMHQTAQGKSGRA